VGSGKTTCFCEIARRCVANGKRVLILVHRKELLDQACTRLGSLPHGCIKAGYPTNPGAPIQVASIPTLRNRDKPPADVIIVDEAHRAKAKTWLEVLNCYPNALVIGFTATPWRLDGKPLGDLFEDMVLACRPQELVDLYHQDPTTGLCPVTGFAYDIPDLSGVRVTGSDYNEGDLEEVMSRPAIIGNILEQWKLHASNLSTVVFASSIDHSEALTAQFCAAGVRAEHIDGTMGRRLREAILERVRIGQTQVISNVGVLTEGTDIPRLKCVILARPTMSLSLYIQEVGRVRRPWGDVIARIHDHAGCVLKHGLPDEDRDWSLWSQPASEPRTRTCKECRAVLPPGAPCPNGCIFETEERGPRQGPELIPDGEQVSLETLAARATEVQWKRHGQSVEGVYIGRERKANKWGGQTDFHTIQEPDRVYSLAGTVDLQRKLAGVTAGAVVRVTYLDDRDVGQKYPMRLFEVRVKK
jgi:superfamily II DNA or RNA helicase